MTINSTESKISRHLSYTKFCCFIIADKQNAQKLLKHTGNIFHCLVVRDGLRRIVANIESFLIYESKASESLAKRRSSVLGELERLLLPG